MEDFPNTPEGRHLWGKAMHAWNYAHGIQSKDLIKQWNEQRKNA